VRERSYSRSRSRSRSPIPNRVLEYQEGLSQTAVAPPAFIEHSQANVTQHVSGFNTVFSLDGLSTIPSVAQLNSVIHDVAIAVLDFPHAELEWEAILTGFVSVYLKCKMKNTSNYTLLDGEVDVFLNNSFVTTAFIPHVRPQESFSCPLGIDPNVSITLHPQTEETQEPRGRIFGSKSVKTTTSRSVTVKNERGLAIERLILKDQVPVTNEPKVKIRIISPAGLQDIGERSLKHVVVEGNKIAARWSPLSQNEDKANEEGFIDWICRVDAADSLNVKLSWEVKAPKKFKWHVTI